MVTHGNKAGFLSAITTHLLNTVPTKKKKSVKMVNDKIKNLKQKWQSTKKIMTKSSGKKATRLWQWFWDCDAVFQKGQDTLTGACQSGVSGTTFKGVPYHD